MKDLLALFPPADFSLIGFILAMPLIGAFVNGVFGKRLGKDAVRLMALTAIGLSFVAAVVTFVVLDHQVDLSRSEVTDAGVTHVKYGHVRLSWLAWEWMRISGPRDASVPIELKFSVDALNGVMMLIVTGVGFLIHVYASSYMDKDKAYWRFFAYLNLFIFSMLLLILGDNLPVLFVGWEGVGLCSYLLIGFWYTKLPNAAAGKKAFIANRVGDFGLLVGMFLLVYYTGALDWQGLEAAAGSLVSTSDAHQVHLWPLGGGQFQGPLAILQPKTPWTITAATAVGLALFLGCTGKSAQIPLYVWLPDAMAGPTPVSALIHAATMVTAGIYLICRLSFIFVLSPATMMVIAFTGALTALLAATIALVQNDIKKVLAYSTVSQLGFMFLGVGSGAFVAGFFHVFTHAFFKACLFLGAGSVIHAMHARVHDDERSQDMRNMGGLRKYMPLTYATFAAATLAIIGFPLTAGFFSKDEILFKALVGHPVHPQAAKLAARNFPVFAIPSWVGPTVYAIGVAAAILTAFYMVRCLILTFFGDFKGWTVGRPSMLAKHEHAHHDDEHGDDDDDHHHEEDLSQPGYPPHESPRLMTIPLIILGTASLFAGFLNPGFLKGLLHWHDIPLDHWLEPVFETATAAIELPKEEALHSKEMMSTVGAFMAFAIGAGAAYWVYIKEKGKPARELIQKVPGLYQLVLDKWRVDELYDRTIINGADALSETAASVDQGIIDLVLARLSALLVAALGTLLRVFQNGVVHVYAAIMVVGMAGLGWFFVAPHAQAEVKAERAGDYVIEAAPGLGYTYRWYPDAAGKPQTEAFGAATQIKVNVEEGKTKVVRLEIKNAFGLTGSKDFTLTRPKAPPKPTQLQLGQNAVPSGERTN